MKLRSGKCKWYKKKRFVSGPCKGPKWNDLEVRSFVYWPLRTRLDPTTKQTGVKNYTAYALSVDEAGNEERMLKKGRNRNTFRIK